VVVTGGVAVEVVEIVANPNERHAALQPAEVEVAQATQVFPTE